MRRLADPSLPANVRHRRIVLALANDARLLGVREFRCFIAFRPPSAATGEGKSERRSDAKPRCDYSRDAPRMKIERTRPSRSGPVGPVFFL